MKQRYMWLVASLLLTATGCRQTNIREVMMNVASQHVDTTGYQRRTIHAASFATVEIDCFADVTYTQTAPGTPCRIELQAHQPLLNKMTFSVVSGSKLVVDAGKYYNSSEREVPVVHIYAPAVNYFELAGGKCLRLGYLKLHTPFSVKLGGVGAILCKQLQAPQVDVVLEGAGSVNLEGIDTNYLRAELSGAGSIRLAGKAAHTQTLLLGAGTVDTTRLVRKT